MTDYSEVFYGTLEHMHSVYPYALEILAFPFNHPNVTIDKCEDAIKSAEKSGGTKVHIMEAIDINGDSKKDMLWIKAASTTELFVALAK